MFLVLYCIVLYCMVLNYVVLYCIILIWMQESHSLRQSNGMLTERMQLVIKRAASATDANKVLSTRLSAVERERDAVRAMIGLERQKASDMSQIVEVARSQLIDKDLMLNR